MKSHLLVLMQFIGIILCAYPNNIITQQHYFYSITAIGIIIGLYTLLHNRLGNFNIYPEVKSEAKLVTSGPYTFIRHPMYLSLILIMLGVTLNKFYYLSIIGFTLVIISISLKAIKEEKYLTEKFSKYQEYTRQTKRIIPWIW